MNLRTILSFLAGVGTTAAALAIWQHRALPIDIEVVDDDPLPRVGSVYGRHEPKPQSIPGKMSS